ncbi:MAG: hypothetical protein D8M58_14025 [Calditrichaeota bacterium]|nr:MAG: hypothetical protein DWQ03_15265 [Calditrichota bacterium]MBL1206517.1 hypothetical protein [Calditrichota bacterium]NOG46345.1 hypothetical protein [Calditrichota bacterium]
MKHLSKLLLSILLTLSSTACVSFSTLQTPKVLENDEKTFGLGITSPIDQDELVPIPELYLRWAAFQDIDMGAKVTGIPFALGVIGMDIKYQALTIDSSFYVSLDFGLSHSSGDFGSTIGYSPAILLGNERIFGGAKLIIADIENDDGFLGSKKGETIGTISEIFIGTSIGDKWRIMPVANLMFSDDFKESIFLATIGFEYRF